MADRPDGKGAGTERVTFTRPAAERIANVVRTVEQGDRDCGPLRFERIGSSSGGGGGTSIRVCTFTGSWAINTVKTLTFQGVTTTPNTVVATNQLFTIGDACQTQVAYIGKVSSSKPSGAAAAWHLLNVQHAATHVVTHVTIGETAMTFYRKLAWIPFPGDATPITFSGATATTC